MSAIEPFLLDKQTLYRRLDDFGKMAEVPSFPQNRLLGKPAWKGDLIKDGDRRLSRLW